MSLSPVIHDHTAPQSEDWGRRRLRKGAASVAREMRDTGHGIGLGYRAEEIMSGTSAKNLSRMAEGMNPVAVTKPTQRWCGTCKASGKSMWQDVGHECG